MSSTNEFHGWFACSSEYALATPNILSLQLCKHIFFIFLYPTFQYLFWLHEMGL